MKNYRLLLLSIFLCLFNSNSFAATAPNLINDLIYWLDGKDINGNGTTPNDGDPINTWVDKSPSGQNATSPSVAPFTTAPPVYDEDAFDIGLNQCGGAPRFGNGSRKALYAPDVFGGTVSELTVFMVTREINRRSHTIWSINGQNMNTPSNQAISRISMHLPWGNGRSYFDFNGCCNSNTTRVFGLTPVPIGGVSINTAYQSAINSNQSLRINGNLIDDNNVGSTGITAGGFIVGSVRNLWFDGHIAEVVMYDRALNNTEILEVEEYLTNKWLNCQNDADIVVSKEVFNNSNCTSPAPNPEENDTIYYCINITNNGPANATNVQLIDNLPAGVTLQGTSATSGTVTP